ncbi:MAG: hypothetical protein NTV52_32220 [Acidobacteria bacterium]|nr:hypothetical protein [Acidobacteriota bacterium]
MRRAILLLPFYLALAAAIVTPTDPVSRSPGKLSPLVEDKKVPPPCPSRPA